LKIIKNIYKWFVFIPRLKSWAFPLTLVIYKLSSKNILHAVVKHKDKYYDPTFGKVYNKINNYRFSIKRENLDNWGKEFGKM